MNGPYGYEEDRIAALWGEGYRYLTPGDYLASLDNEELDGQMCIEEEYEAIDRDRVERARRQRERVIDWMAEG